MCTQEIRRLTLRLKPLFHSLDLPRSPTKKIRLEPLREWAQQVE